MSESNETAAVESSAESPPPADRPAGTAPDPRARLHEMARRLRRVFDRGLMEAYLRERRALR